MQTATSETMYNATHGARRETSARVPDLMSFRAWESEVSTEMSGVSGRKRTSLTRSVLLSLAAVLISVCALTLTASKADAAVAALDGWVQMYAAAPNTTTGTLTTTTAVTVSAGSNRLLVAGVCIETGANALINTMDVRLTNASGPLFTTGSLPSSAQRENCWIGYLADADIPAPGTYQLYINWGLSTSTAASLTVAAGTYQGVDQTLPETVCFAWNSATASVPFGNQVDYVAGSVTVYVAANGGSGASISDNASPAFATALTSQTAQQSMYARSVANATAGNYPTSVTVSFAGTTSTRSSVAIVSLLPAPTDVTPPIAGTMSVTPDAGGFTSASPTITGTFTDNESGLTTCEYTTNGSTWSATGVTITNDVTPGVHQCTVTPTGLTGSLTINMRASSSGGGPTTNTAISRTVDATPPTNGTLTVTPGNLKNTLDWSGITDAGSGLAPTGTYTIRWATGATPPANCTAGTLLGTYDSGTLTANHLGLTNGTTYSYRICAIDLAGNQNTGATGSGTPAIGPREVLGSTNTAIATSPQNDTNQSVVMQRIQVTSAASPQGAGDGLLELAGVGVTELGTATAFNNAMVYISTTSSATLPVGAVLIGSTGLWTGATTTVSLNQGTLADRQVATGTPKYLYFVLAMQPGQSGNTVQTRVTAISVAAPDDGQTGLVYNSNSITLQPGPKATITACSDCHGFPPADGTARNVPGGRFPGAHDKHANSYAMACTTCHVDNTVIGFGHQSGVINLANPIGGDAGSSYTKGQNFPQSNTVTDGYCLNVYCHSNGAGGTNQAGDSRTRGWVTSPSWVNGSIATCTVCHTSPPNYANRVTTWGTAKSNSHSSHTTDCSKCHGNTTTNNTSISNTANHANGIYDVVQQPGLTTFSYSYNVGGGSCANISCHGGSTAQWGVTQVDCTVCHSGTLTKTLGGGGTIRNVTGAGGDFTQASRHLISTSTILKWDCIVCHMEGQYTGANAGKADPTYHQEGAGAAGGRINLRNVDSPATGWAVDNVAWTPTDYTNLDTFCLTCHDADGANGISVNATNSGLDSTAPTTRRLTPFNTTDFPGGVVGASTWNSNAGPRTAVINIKDKFFAGTGVGAAYNGNPSQHAVIGKRYSTVWTSWLASTWSSVILKKTGVNVNVSRETSLLTCADCHALDTGNGAHGGSISYNMIGTNAVSNFCWRCHAQAVYTLSGTSQAGSRVQHSGLDSRTNTGTGYLLPSGQTWNCMLCHASYDYLTTVSRNQSYGGIHGTWSSTATWGTAGISRTMNRFLPGVWMRPTPASDTAWNSTTAFSCYFNTNGTNNFSGCTSHSGASTNGRSFLYGRPPKY